MGKNMLRQPLDSYSQERQAANGKSSWFGLGAAVAQWITLWAADHLDAGAGSREESSTLFSLLLIFPEHLWEVLPEAEY